MYFNFSFDFVESSVPLKPAAVEVLDADVKDENDILNTMSTDAMATESPHLELQNENDEYEEDEPVLPGNYDDSFDDKTDPLYIPIRNVVKKKYAAIS